MTAAELIELATELGIDAIGAAPIASYDDAERRIRDRQTRQVGHDFNDNRFGGFIMFFDDSFAARHKLSTPLFSKTPDF